MSAWSLWLGAVSSVEAQEVLQPYEIVNGAITAPLTSTAGDPQRGKAVAANSDRGNCLICHAMPIKEAPVFGNVGPDLSAVGQRLSAGQLRLRIVDPKILNPNTAMPAYYKVNGLKRVAPQYAGKPILSAQEIEDVVAYLVTLTGSTADPRPETSAPRPRSGRAEQ